MFLQQCKSIHILLLWAKFHWKIPLGKWFFKIWPKSKWGEIKIGYLPAILKRYKILKICLQNCDFLLPVRIWCKFHCKIPVGKWISCRLRSFSTSFLLSVRLGIFGNFAPGYSRLISGGILGSRKLPLLRKSNTHCMISNYQHTSVNQKSPQVRISRMSPLCWMALKRAGNPVGSSFLMSRWEVRFWCKHCTWLAKMALSMIFWII